MTYYTGVMMLVWLTLVVLGILVYENDRIPRNDKRILFITYGIVAVSSLAEWLGVQFNGDVALPAWSIKLVKFFDYMLTPIAGGALIFHLHRKSVVRHILLALLGLNTIIQIVSLFTGWMIVVNEDNIYSHGPGYIAYVICYMVVTLLVIVEFGLYGRNFRRQNRLSLYGILLFVLIGTSLQEIFSGDVRTAYIALTTGLCFFYIHYTEFALIASDDQIHEQMIQISLDSLTGIKSRYAYNNAISNLSSPLKDDLVVFSLDVNGLKSTNDNLGHIAGDELITGAAKCITSVFERYGDCFRTGGDEFIVLVNTDKEMIPILEAQLKEKAEEWEGSKVKKLSLAIGSACASDNPGITPDQLISLADKEMYKSKSEFYKSTGIDRRKR